MSAKMSINQQKQHVSILESLIRFLIIGNLQLLHIMQVVEICQIYETSGKSNYWDIRPFLPPETQNYIPAFIAAVYVMNFAQDYGITVDKKINQSLK